MTTQNNNNNNTKAPKWATNRWAVIERATGQCVLETSVETFVAVIDRSRFDVVELSTLEGAA